MKIGIYGGSFNPVHKGHVHLASEAAAKLGLDKVYFIPSKISPHRSTAEYVPEKDRLAMLEIVCRSDERFEVSDYELRSDRVSYTIYTIEHFRRKFPGDELYLLVGSDMLLMFDKWRSYDRILEEAVLAVVSRQDGDIRQLEKKAEELNYPGRIIICSTDAVEISSSEIRRNIRENVFDTCYLDENVVKYIKSNGLYR
ncbi:MAG: nicotinate (nicotinamide) nucleotide adenylyltransferase [Ruminococcus sp.]|nr:nicotinate (nicotinamide) nucleotide adenylyltransferase [Ruminococcus sp.]